ncbi:MAG TPA: MmcQ/YjbR family DNA-binding protein [Caulobacteraceae bacterium]|nr:MmcQ/YjbR family DNA-binding protein [Caulobacteraceae bacterium]
MTEEEFRAILMAFPGVEEGTSHGQPAFLVRGKFLTRLRGEDRSVVLLDVGFDERDLLMEAEPETFHTTEHYRNYPSVLARLANIHPDALRGLLERRWRKVSLKKMVKAWDECRKAG